MLRRFVLLVLPQLLNAASVSTYDTPSLLTYNGKAGNRYNGSNFVAADKHGYVMAEEGLTVAAHPSYVVETSTGNMLLTGDSFGTGTGRGWANLFNASAALQWAWQSSSKAFDAVLGAVTLPDETVVLGGTRSVAGRWELLLVAIQPDGQERWSSTLSLSSPQHGQCAANGASNCFGVIYWMDTDPSKELVILGGVTDFPHDAGSIAWKSGGGQPDVGGVPFLAAIPFSSLATAPTADDITVHYFDNGPGFTTVISLRAEHGQGVIALLPLNPFGGSVARMTYNDSGHFQQEWISALKVNNEVTDISIVGDSADATAYVVSATVNPGAKIEALSTDGNTLWNRSYDIASTFPPEMTPHGQRNWCQECWSIASYGDEVMLSCGAAELQAGDLNCDDGLWRSLLVTFNFHSPASASYRLFGEDENFSVEYAAFGADGKVLCAIDADSGASIVGFAHD